MPLLSGTAGVLRGAGGRGSRVTVGPVGVGGVGCTLVRPGGLKVIGHRLAVDVVTVLRERSVAP
jgi:hypothetical protein